MFKINTAIISVNDKSNLIDLAKVLINKDITLFASGGTYAYLNKLNLKVTAVEKHLNQPEILDGRVKTLHPKIFGGILNRTTNQSDQDTLTLNQITSIDLIVVNLYSFANNIDTIDIGGHAMIRAAAKNFEHKLVLIDHHDYPWLCDKLNKNDPITLEERLYFAKKVFEFSASLETAIANFFVSQNKIQNNYNLLPQSLSLNLNKVLELRYGENPDSAAAIYTDLQQKNLPELLQGKELSYNNLLDANAALLFIEDFIKITDFNNQNICVIIKHTNPCGMAVAPDIITAYHRAYVSDPNAAFGGIIAFNNQITEKLASYILENQFVEVLIAPSYSRGAREIFKRKPNIRILKNINCTNNQISFVPINKIVPKGYLVQQYNSSVVDLKIENFKIVTKEQTIDAELASNLIFAWQAVGHIKSNAIVVTKNLATIGIGSGQSSRIASMKIALNNAIANNHDLTNAVIASDGFFPFEDAIILAKQFNIKAIMQPGGSINDQKIIDKANELNILMIFTNTRKFYH